MSNTKISFRNGLPYGWWKNTDVWAAAISIGSLIALFILGAIVLAAYFADFKPVY